MRSSKDEATRARLLREAAYHFARLGYDAAQAEGELAAFDVEAFSLWVASYMLGYHGAPGLRISLQRSPWSATRARQQFVGMVRNMLRGAAMTAG